MPYAQCRAVFYSLTRGDAYQAPSAYDGGVRWRVQILKVLGMCVVMSGNAFADSQEESFAHFFSVAPATVRDVVGYKTPTGIPVTHVILGHYEKENQVWPGLVLMRCNDKECRGSHVYLHPPKANIEILGIVDLLAAGPVGERTSLDKGYRGQWVAMDRSVKSPKTMAWPALMVKVEQRTRESDSSRFGGSVVGERRETRLILVSLRASEENAPQLLDTSLTDLYPTGAGTTTSYRLVSGEGKSFDLVATEQRHIEDRSRCLNPPPVEYRLVFNGHGYQRQERGIWPRTGCH